jgi:hypothetical protein
LLSWCPSDLHPKNPTLTIGHATGSANRIREFTDSISIPSFDRERESDDAVFLTEIMRFGIHIRVPENLPESRDQSEKAQILPEGSGFHGLEDLRVEKLNLLSRLHAHRSPRDLETVIPIPREDRRTDLRPVLESLQYPRLRPSRDDVSRRRILQENLFGDVKGHVGTSPPEDLPRIPEDFQAEFASVHNSLSLFERDTGLACRREPGRLLLGDRDVHLGFDVGALVAVVAEQVQHQRLSKLGIAHVIVVVPS